MIPPTKVPIEHFPFVKASQLTNLCFHSRIGFMTVQITQREQFILISLDIQPYTLQPPPVQFLP